MKVWIDLVFFLFLSLVISSAHAEINLNRPLLTNFAELVSSVEIGDNVIAIIHLDRCQIIKPEDQALKTQLTQSIIGASTRFNFTQYLHYNPRTDAESRDMVTTSMTTEVEQSTPGLYWAVFARLSVFEDNSATLHIDYFDPINHKSQSVLEWRCDISKGNDTNGLYLMDNF